MLVQTIFLFTLLFISGDSRKVKTQPPAVASADSTVYRYNYTILFNCSTLCQGQNRDLEILYLVKSAAVNKELREAIRNTWGRTNYDNRVASVFLMGVNTSANGVAATEALLAEAKHYQDIVLAVFQDTYNNLTLKSVMGLRWAHEFCPRSTYYVLVDDDSYVSTKNLRNYLRSRDNKNDPWNKYPLMFLQQTSQVRHFHQLSHLFGGFLHPEGAPQTVAMNKNGVTKEEYPYPQYPVFVSGNFIVMGNVSLHLILLATKETKFFRMEDVYLSFVALRAGLSPISIPGVFNLSPPGTNISRFATVIASHYITSADLRKIWRFQRLRNNV